MWHVETDVFALAVFIIMLIKKHLYRKSNNDLQGKAFYLVLLFSIFSNVIDIISSTAMNDCTNWWVYQILMPIYVITMPMLAAVWVCYAYVLIHRKQRLYHEIQGKNKDLKEAVEKAEAATHAKNGQESIDVFSSSELNHFDAILMDVRMPIMDGIAATKAIRALNRADATTIPIIVMTADAFEEQQKETIQAGMTYHLSKPIDPSLLYHVLATYLITQD